MICSLQLKGFRFEGGPALDCEHVLARAFMGAAALIVNLS